MSSFYTKVFDAQPGSYVRSQPANNEFQLIQNGFAAVEAVIGKTLRAADALSVLPAAGLRAGKLMSCDSLGNFEFVITKVDFAAAVVAAEAAAASAAQAGDSEAGAAAARTGAEAARDLAVAARQGAEAARDEAEALVDAAGFAPASHVGAGGTAHANAVAGGAAGFMTGADKTKLDGVTAGATANAADAQLRDRSTHTGTQTASTISDFAAAVTGVVDTTSGGSLITTIERPTLLLDYANAQALGGADEFTRAGSAYAIGQTGLSAVVLANQPRFDFNALTGASRGLVMEHSTTNYWPHSEGTVSNFSGAGVTDAAMAGFANSLYFVNNASTRYVGMNASTAPGSTVLCLSFFIEMDDGGVPVGGLSGNSSADYAVSINGSLVASGFQAEQINARRWRVSVSGTSNASPGANDVSINKYANQSARGFKVSGIQLEPGTVSSSYTKTAGGAGSRAGEFLSVPLTSDWFNWNEGTLLLECNYDGTSSIMGGSRVALALAPASGYRAALMNHGSTVNGVYVMNSGGSPQFQRNGGSASSAPLRAAFSYSGGNYQHVVQGGAVGSGSGAAVMGDVTQLLIGGLQSGSNQLRGRIPLVAYWPRALTATELAHIVA